MLRRFDDDVRNGRLSETEKHAHEVVDFEAVVGKGVRASVDGGICFVGSPRLFEEVGVPLASVEDQLRVLSEDGKTVPLVGTERELVEVIFADALHSCSRTNSAFEPLVRLVPPRLVVRGESRRSTSLVYDRGVG